MENMSPNSPIKETKSTGDVIGFKRKAESLKEVTSHYQGRPTILIGSDLSTYKLNDKLAWLYNKVSFVRTIVKKVLGVDSKKTLENLKTLKGSITANYDGDNKEEITKLFNSTALLVQKELELGEDVPLIYESAEQANEILKAVVDNQYSIPFKDLKAVFEKATNQAALNGVLDLMWSNVERAPDPSGLRTQCAIELCDLMESKPALINFFRAERCDASIKQTHSPDIFYESQVSRLMEKLLKSEPENWLAIANGGLNSQVLDADDAKRIHEKIVEKLENKKNTSSYQTKTYLTNLSDAASYAIKKSSWNPSTVLSFFKDHWNAVKDYKEQIDPLALFTDYLTVCSQSKMGEPKLQEFLNKNTISAKILVEKGELADSDLIQFFIDKGMPIEKEGDELYFNPMKFVQLGIESLLRH